MFLDECSSTAELETANATGGTSWCFVDGGADVEIMQWNSLRC